MAKRPGAASASEATHWARQRRRPGVGRHDRRAEPQPRLPRRGQGQRREGVGAVGLGRPDVGVAEVGQLGELVAVGVQRAGQRHGHAGADRAGSWRRVLLDRRRVAAAARSVPEPHDAALAGRGEQRAVLGEHVHQAVAEAALDGVDPDVEQHPLGRHEVARRAACCRGCCRRRGCRAPGRRPSARSRRARPARRRRRRRAPRGCAPTSACGRRRACRRARRGRGPWPAAGRAGR